MGLLDDLAAPPRRMVPFAEWVIAQPADHRKALDAAGLDTRWSHSALEKLFRNKYGVACSIDSIRAWRAGLGYSE